MQKLKVLGLALMAMFAIGIAVSATASAAEVPEFLCLGTCSFPITFTGKIATGKLLTAIGSVECTEAGTTEGEITSAKKGTAKSIDFKGCLLAANKEKCNTTTDAAGVILLNSVAFHLVAYKLSAKLLAGILFLPAEVLFECGAVKIKVKGSPIALVAIESPITEAESKNLLLLWDIEEVGGKKKQDPEKCELPAAICEGKTYGELANLGLGFETAVFEETHVLLVLSTDVKIDF